MCYYPANDKVNRLAVCATVSSTGNPADCPGTTIVNLSTSTDPVERFCLRVGRKTRDWTLKFMGKFKGAEWLQDKIEARRERHRLISQANDSLLVLHHRLNQSQSEDGQQSVDMLYCDESWKKTSTYRTSRQPRLSNSLTDVSNLINRHDFLLWNGRDNQEFHRETQEEREARRALLWNWEL